MDKEELRSKIKKLGADLCPVNALEKEELDQKKCYDYCFGEVGGIWAIKCHAGMYVRNF